MRLDWVKIDGFKNLNNFKIDLDETRMHTILLGENATGKSNFLEALILIFKYFDFDLKPDKRPFFNFEIKYKCNENELRIKYWNKKPNPTLFKDKEEKTSEKDLEIFLDDEKISQKKFKENKKEYLPQYIFTYYSGISNRLDEHFWDSQKRFYDKIIKPNTSKEDIDDLRRLFYVKLIHSYFVLLAFFSFDDKEGKKFLKEYLGIEGLDSVLFVLKKPNWKGKGDKRFWGARGLVQEFLSELWDLSIAPIYNSESIHPDFKSKARKQESLFLYISNEEKLKKLASYYETNTSLFKALESTYISDILEEVKVRVKIRSEKNDNITFRDLSEGEQQLLTVLGLLKFTKEKESLILLDEPDTHLNPLWKWEYLQLLNKVVKRDKSTQLIINTHDPLVIGSLIKEEVLRFDKSNGKISVNQLDVDPRGMGVQGILTTIFGLPTTVDTKTFDKIKLRNKLVHKMDESGLSEREKIKLRKLFKELNSLGFAEADKDPDYLKFLIEQEKNRRDKTE